MSGSRTICRRDLGPRIVENITYGIANYQGTTPLQSLQSRRRVSVLPAWLAMASAIPGTLSSTPRRAWRPRKLVRAIAGAMTTNPRPSPACCAANERRRHSGLASTTRFLLPAMPRGRQTSPRDHRSGHQVSQSLDLRMGAHWSSLRLDLGQRLPSD